MGQEEGLNAVQWGCGDILRRGERLLLVSTPAPLSLSASELPFASAPEFPRLRRWTQAWPPGLKTVTVQSQAAQEAQEPPLGLKAQPQAPVGVAWPLHTDVPCFRLLHHALLVL